jgi:Butyrate kinase
MEYNILVINPGSTSTKIAYYRKGEQLLLTNVEHSPDCLAMQNSKKEQIDFRQTEILQVLNEAGIDLKELDGVASRGGTFGKMHSGAYLVDEELVHASMSPDASHASNLGAVIAFDIAKMYGVKAYIYDAVSADETQEIAHYTGLKGVYRKNRTHVLNTKAICRRTAEECGCRYEDMNFIAVHIGGGISVNAHKKGDIIDSVSGDDGPMSVQRAGGFSTLTLIELCFCGKYTREQLEKIVMTEGGIVSHFGTYDVKSVEEKAGNGDGYAKTIMAVPI